MSAEHHEIIEELAFPYKVPDAYRALLDLGIRALPAVRVGEDPSRSEAHEILRGLAAEDSARAMPVVR